MAGANDSGWAEHEAHVYCESINEAWQRHPLSPPGWFPTRISLCANAYLLMERRVCRMDIVWDGSASFLRPINPPNSLLNNPRSCERICLRASFSCSSHTPAIRRISS
jgi:hypothetical protein